jgi:hypothetical protein
MIDASSSCLDRYDPDNAGPDTYLIDFLCSVLRDAKIPHKFVGFDPERYWPLPDALRDQK